MAKARTSLVVQWLGRLTPSAGDPYSIPSKGDGSHALRLKVRMAQGSLGILEGRNSLLAQPDK